MELGLLALLIVIALATYFKKSIKSDDIDYSKKILELEKSVASKVEIINQIQKSEGILNAKMTSFEQLKTEKTQAEVRLQATEQEYNALKTKLTTLESKEENRIESLRKSLDKSNALQESLEKEKERLNDERVAEKSSYFEKMKKKWGNHEKDIENHIQLICKNHILEYISQENFPYPRNKPDNTIKISEQYIIFDAKSPLSDDLSNFPTYIKNQTDNLKKYAKHSDVKKDLFLVIPSNTLSSIDKFTYNMGDYNVFVITKDSIEPIIISLKKIQDFQLVEKLSPEERDDICRIIGKFAHTTKRRIQIDQYFAEEFLDTLKKSRSQLPKEVLKRVIEFESAEKLNPPMEKRNKKILTQELIDKRVELNKEIQIRDIPQIDAKISFKEDNIK
ncbi:hypothetical protein OAP97_00920 [Flavobacteriales bacterium]|jgi:hypothetical protein|nr:hypothetical protein [Flavobacteriales bacterium]MDC1069274.1 hypothetical protein [Flavobacteriales bacterium]